LLHKGDWEGVYKNTSSLSARELLQYIMDDDDVKPIKKKSSKKKKKRKSVRSTKHKSTGVKKKKKSKKKKYPPSLVEPNASSDSVSVLSDGLGATYLASEKVGLVLGAVLEEDDGCWGHLPDTTCLEDEKTEKTKTPPPKPEATTSDNPESDNADMVLDHLSLLMDRLLDEEEYDISKWVQGTQWAIEDEKEDDRSKRNSHFVVPGEERSRPTYEDESGPTRPRELFSTQSEALPESTRTSVSKTKASKHKSLAKKEHTVVRKTASFISFPTSPSSATKSTVRDDLPMIVETKPRMARRRTLPFLRSLSNKNKNNDRDDLKMLVETKAKRRSLPSVPFLRSFPNKNNDRDDLPMIVETKPKRSSMLSKMKKMLQKRDGKK
jgi:hypothetical protein